MVYLKQGEVEIPRAGMYHALKRRSGTEGRLPIGCRSFEPNSRLAAGTHVSPMDLA